MLSDAQIARYSRQIILPAVGGQGQQRLLQAKMAIVGDQEMARTAALYLSGAGVGELACFGHGWSAEALGSSNPDCRVWFAPLPEAAPVALRGCALVLDASGSAVVSAELNAYCCAAGTALVWGYVTGAVGQATVFAGSLPQTPCYQCWRSRAVAAAEPWSSAAALLSRPVEAFIGTLLATEAIKLVLGLEPTLAGRLVCCNGLDFALEQVVVDQVPGCPACARTGEPSP